MTDDVLLAIVVFLVAWRAGFVAGVQVGAQREAAHWRAKFWRS